MQRQPRRARRTVRVARRLTAAVAVWTAIGGTASVLVAWVTPLLDDELQIDALATAAARRAAWADPDPSDEGLWIERVFTNGWIDLVQVHDRSGRWHEHRTGWPWRGLVVRSDPEDRATLAAGRLRLLGPSINAPPTLLMTVPRAWPWRPLWPGFAANTALYAAVAAALVLTIRIVRGGSRRWRKRCPGCGYPAGASPRCPECGRTHPASTIAETLRRGRP